MKTIQMTVGAALVLAGRLVCVAADAASGTAAPDWPVVKLVQGGREALAAGDVEKAKTLAEAAVTRDPGYVEGWKLTGALRLRDGNTNLAVRAYRTALTLAPNDVAAGRELGWLLWGDDLDKAVEVLDVTVRKGAPDRDAVIRRVLATLAESGKPDKALELFARWKPGFTLSQYGLALFKDGRRTAAQPFLDAAWKAGQDQADIGLYLAFGASRKGDAGRVVECLSAFLEKAPAPLPGEQDELFWDTLIAVAGKPEIKGLWDSVARRYPSDQARRDLLAGRMEKAAYAARHRGSIDPARELFRQTLDLSPNRGCWADWTLLEERMKGAQQANALLQTLMGKITDKGIREGVSARLAHYEGDFDGAIEGYRKCLEREPGQIALRLFLVRDLLASSKLEDARNEIKLAEPAQTSLKGEDRAQMADFWLEVGDVLHALELDRNLLIEKSKALTAVEDWDGALRMATMATTNDPANADAWLQLGYVHSRTRKFAEARVALERAVSIKPTFAPAWLELGWALWALPDREAACKAWDKAITLGVKDPAKVARQAVGNMAEEGHADWALQWHAKWLPDVLMQATGLDFARSGRMKAAEPFLAKAWNEGVDKPVTGLALAKVRAVNGVFAGTPDYLMPFISSCLATAAPAEVATVLDTLRQCSGVAGAGDVLDAVAKGMTGRPDQVAVTDVYIVFARDDQDRAKLASALTFYEKALARDSNRTVWRTALNLANRLQDQPRGMALLKGIQAKATAPAVKTGVAAKLAELKGEFAAAREGYLASLKAEPDQPDLHGDLFEVSLRLGDTGQANSEAKWVEAQVNAGQVRLRDTLALMWAELGEDEKALELWQFLHLSMPDIPFYGTEMAMAQYRTGRGNEAIDTLKDTNRRTPTALGFELLAQIQAALGKPADAVATAREGLKTFPSPALRRALAENLEMTAPKDPGAVAAAEASLADDPGSASLALLTGRFLDQAGRSDEAVKRHQDLLKRNRDFVPSLIYLRDRETATEHPRTALPYAERLVKVRPWDDVAARRYAMTLAEADGFSRAVRILEPLAKREKNSVTACLLYDDVTPFDYAGRNTTRQLATHVARLAKDGYAFVTAVPPPAGVSKAVLLVLVDPDKAVIEAADAVLKAQNARAVVLVSPEELKRPMPRKPTPERLAQLKETGRWLIGTTREAGSAPKDTVVSVEPVGKATDAAFFLDDSGFISAQPALEHLPAKSVPVAWDSQALADHLNRENSVVRSRLELAKLFYWHGQSEVAAYWFRKSREAGADPFETTFNEAANAAMEGDLPSALAKSRDAVTLAPADEHRPAALLEKALTLRRPTASLRGTEWWDNEDRSYWSLEAAGEGPITDWLRWQAELSRRHWETKGLGSEDGTEAGLGFLAYVVPEVWLEAGLQEWLMADLPDWTGWRARLHLPNPMFHGNVELVTEREPMETVEAIRKGIRAHREGIQTYSRVVDFWDVFANGALTERSDGNNTWWVDGRIIRRVKETPYLGVGYAGRFADSTTQVPEYWSPEELQQHQVYAALQGTGSKWGAQLSGQAGYAKERGTAWRYVWGAKAAGSYFFTKDVSVGADVQHQGGPIYDRTTVDGYLNVRW